MKIYSIADKHGRNFDLFEGKFYENSNPTYCLDVAYLNEIMKHDKFKESHVVTTIIEDADLKHLDLY